MPRPLGEGICREVLPDGGSAHSENPADLADVEPFLAGESTSFHLPPQASLAGCLGSGDLSFRAPLGRGQQRQTNCIEAFQALQTPFFRMEEAFQDLPEVVQEVPPVGHLHRLGSPLGDPTGIFGRTITLGNFDSGMCLKPAFQPFGGPIRKHVYGTPLLKIDQNRPPGLAFAPRPVVNAQHAWHGLLPNRMPTEHPEKGVWTCLHPKYAQESGSGFRSHREADVSLRLCKPGRPSCVCRKQIRERLDKRAARALLIQTPKPAHTQMEPNRPVANWKIGWGS